MLEITKINTLQEAMKVYFDLKLKNQDTTEIEKVIEKQKELLQAKVTKKVMEIMTSPNFEEMLVNKQVKKEIRAAGNSFFNNK